MKSYRKKLYSMVAGILILCGCSGNTDTLPENSNEIVEESHGVSSETGNISGSVQDIPNDSDFITSEEAEKEQAAIDEEIQPSAEVGYSGKYSGAVLSDQDVVDIRQVIGTDISVESEDDAFELASYLLGFPREHEELELEDSYKDNVNTYYTFTLYHDDIKVYGADIRLFVDPMTGGIEMRTTGYDCIYEDMPDFELADILAEAGIDQSVYINKETIYLLDTKSNKAIPCIKCDSESYLEDTLLIDITEKNIRWRHPNIIID